MGCEEGFREGDVRLMEGGVGEGVLGIGSEREGVAVDERVQWDQPQGGLKKSKEKR